MTLTPLRPDDPAALGSYRLTARLGTGGMGVVYLGADSTGRPAAIKIVREDCAADPAFRSRFRHEIEAVQAIESRWTAQLLDADADADRPWLATEYVPGPNLGEAATGGTPLRPDRVRAIAADLAAALQAIHAAGVVHRDLKPGNVVLGIDGLKVIDFGIAAAAAQTVVTRTGVVLGSLGYTAPEQLTGASPVTAAADIFSWGVTVVFAATGRCPFGQGSPEALLFRVVYEPPDLTGVPVDLLAAVADAVQKNPELRPTASQLVHRTTLAAGATAAHDIAAHDIAAYDVANYGKVNYNTLPSVSGKWCLPVSWLCPPGGRLRRPARSLAGVALVAAIAAVAVGGGLLAAGGHPDRQGAVADSRLDAAAARPGPMGAGSPEVAWLSDALPPGTVDPAGAPGHPSAGAGAADADGAATMASSAGRRAAGRGWRTWQPASASRSPEPASQCGTAAGLGLLGEDTVERGPEVLAGR